MPFGASILLHQSKASDLVNYQLHLWKLTYVRFDKVAVKWFSSYLRSSKQKGFNFITYNKYWNSTGQHPGSAIVSTCIHSIWLSQCEDKWFWKCSDFCK